MARQGQYQGSEAFSHIVPGDNEFINPNTASLNYEISLIELKGIRPSIDLKLKLFYGFGMVGTFGLPNGWSLDLPYVLEDKSVTTNGRTYIIDPDWSDTTGYKSGLKYLNNHGIQFRKVTPPQDLPSGLPGTYRYRLVHMDGSQDFFDTDGKPREHRDIYGNFIYYRYIGVGQGRVDDPLVKLDYIQDSWGQRIQFRYMEGRRITFTLPSEASTVLSYTQDGILTVEDPEGHETKFTYLPLGYDLATKALSKITYPTGLESRYDYLRVRYLDENGITKYMPAVSSHKHFDKNGTMYSYKGYDLGALSDGSTYTGAAIYARMGGDRDVLVDGNGQALTYKYDVIQSIYDENSNRIAKTITWFNNYHLPTKQVQFTMNGNADLVESYMTEYRYDIPLDSRAREPSYNYPISTEVFHNTSLDAEPSWAHLSRSTVKYNEFGNTTESTEELYVDNKWIKQTIAIKEYTTTSHNIQIMTKSTQTDEVTRTMEQTQSEVTADGRSIDSTTTSFCAGSDRPLKPWTKRSFIYDTQGRNISETIAWAPGATVPEGSVREVTNTVDYSFANGILTQKSRDAGGNITTDRYDVKRYYGPLVSRTLPLGQTEGFEYDGISRLKKQTDALGHVTTTTYIVGPSGASETVETPTGYVKRTDVDVMGREILVVDNGDPTKPYTKEPSRVLGRMSYDFCSRVKDSTDKLGLTTEYSYDALDRQLSITDPKQNVVRYEYDDTKLTVRQTLNGDLRSFKQLDGRSNEISEVTHPDSSDSITTYLLEEETVYDGTGREISKSVKQIPKLGGNAVILQKLDIEYGPDSTIPSRTFTGYVTGGHDIVKRDYTFDLFNNAYTWCKETTYYGGQTFKHRGPVEIYDTNNRISVACNQMGQEEVYTYDANGWLKKMELYDGSEVNYACNNTGQFIKTSYSSGMTELDYDAEGRLCEIKEGDNTITYKMALDGTLTETIYGDGRSQTCCLDKYSRAVKETDVHGVVRETAFLPNGDISKRSCKGDTVTYDYGIVNHTNGQCTGFTVTGGRAYSTSVTYDGLYRLRQTTAKDSMSKTLLDNVYTIDGMGKVASLQTTSETTPSLNCQRILEYDGLGQITKDSRTGGVPTTTAYTYDGNSNVLSKVIDGTTTSMAYNEIDQRTDAGFQYDTNGRMVRDNQGYQYQFDHRDRLVSVQVADGKTSGFEYGADGYLSHQRGPTGNTDLYHSMGKVMAMTVADSKGNSENTSLFHSTGALTAGYTEEHSHYLLDTLGSTTLIGGKDQDISITYDAYGTPTSSSALKPWESFGFAQEFTDQTSGLVYLRTRYYSPKHMAFLSMDRNHQENRYAYCDGDPINNIDPIGLFFKKLWKGIKKIAKGIAKGVEDAWNATKRWVAPIIGVAVGAIVTIATAGLAAPLVGAIGAAVIGGALGGVAASFVGAKLSGNSYGWRDLIVDGVLGALGGLIGAGSVSAAAKQTTTQLAKGLLKEGFKNTVITGVFSMARNVIFDQPLDPLDWLFGMGLGFFSGAGSAYGGKALDARQANPSPRARAQARQALSRLSAGHQAKKLGEIETNSPLSMGLSSSLEADAVDMASGMTRPRVGTLTRSGGIGLIEDGLPLYLIHL